ncbi:metal-dependent protein hydrolase [Polychaeton citri CBS 116435]|uniref:Metal-dependent protein hydrolase n=1 Tax=Polychaeton citri CBS 116435 TaxID=1314669 RepID=A0A9P4QCP5_9PEZI|nr:metal-dependent protein hydrolase [Polychaeton citri CBS 116435]
MSLLCLLVRQLKPNLAYRRSSHCYSLSGVNISSFSALQQTHISRRLLRSSVSSPRFITSDTPALMTSEPDSKRVKMSNGATPRVIGTHNGHFHADEALAVYLLRTLQPYASSTLIRTRDPEVLKTCDIVVDVGGVHDHSVFRYDHHQREFAATFPGKGTKLSSAGLVWMHYGKDIIKAVTGAENEDDIELLYQKLYEDFVEAFDGNDNGIAAYDPQELRKAGIEKKFSDKGFSIASVVNRYNYAPLPTSNGLAPPPKNEKSQDEEDARFLRASAFVGEQFASELLDKYSSWLPARTVVSQAFSERSQYDDKGRIIVIPWRPEGTPWMDHLYALEDATNSQGQVLYALFAENGEPDSKWRIRAVSLEPGSFENRKGLPEAWRGVRDDQLSELSGIPGCIFVHAGGFIGGNKTFEGALEMAKKACASE